MEYTIDDLLNMLQCPQDTSSPENKLSAREIWDMIANKESHEKMGFASEEELKSWISDNPYSNL